MNPSAERPLPAPEPTDDASIGVLRLIARRADELRRAPGTGHQAGDLECWLQAEREVLESDGAVFQRI